MHTPLATAATKGLSVTAPTRSQPWSSRGRGVGVGTFPERRRRERRPLPSAHGEREAPPTGKGLAS